MPFCPNCGKALEKNEKCTCSTPAQTQTENVTPENKPEKAKGKKPLVLVALIAVVVVIAVVAILILTAKPHMKPFKDFMSAINKQNTSYIELNQTLMPDFAAKKLDKVCKALLKNEDYVDNQESNSRGLESSYLSLTNSFGDWKLKFELKNESLLTGDDLTRVQTQLRNYYANNLASEAASYEVILNNKEQLEDYADDMDLTKGQAKNYLEALIDYYNVYKEVEVGEVYEIKGKFLIKVGREKYDTDTLKFYVANVNGDWFLYSFNEGDFEFDEEVSGYTYFIRNYLTYGRYFMRVR